MDLEALALRYSLADVIDALRELRTTPGQAFMPRPDEVAQLLEDRAEEARRQSSLTETQRKREREIGEFWAWAPGWMADTGNDEAELLRRFPSYRGTKPREAA